MNPELQAYTALAFLVGASAFCGCLFGAALGVYVGLRIGGSTLVTVWKEQDRS